MLASITTLAEVAGPEEAAQAADYVEYFRGNEALITKALSGVTEKTKVCFLWGTGSDLWSYGSNTVQHALLTTAGGDNVFAYLGDAKAISLEDVIAAAPDVIVCSRKADWQEYTTAEEWKDIPAVKTGRVYYSPKGFNGYIAVAPEIAMGMVWAANCIYPDQMAAVGVDFPAMIKDFYKRFMNYDVTDEQVQKIINAEY